MWVYPGKVVLHTSETRGQRGLNAQPWGMLVNDGIAPSIWFRRRPGVVFCGSAPIKPCVYG
jgi:hypothetical protein